MKSPKPCDEKYIANQVKKTLAEVKRQDKVRVCKAPKPVKKGVKK